MFLMPIASLLVLALVSYSQLVASLLATSYLHLQQNVSQIILLINFVRFNYFGMQTRGFGDFQNLRRDYYVVGVLLLSCNCKFNSQRGAKR